MTNEWPSSDTDSTGNIYLSGYFAGTVDFGGTALTSVGNLDMFVVKLGPDGIFLSNGPGDPEPCTYAIEAAREFIARRHRRGAPGPMRGRVDVDDRHRNGALRVEPSQRDGAQRQVEVER